MIRNPLILLALATLVGACGDDDNLDALALACVDHQDPDKPTTASEAGITLTYTTGLRADPGAAEFVLGGAAEHELDFAIRRIQVAGVDATSQGFNFSQWTASLKLAALQTMPVDEQGRVTLDVSVTDACGTYTAEPLLVTVAAPPRFVPDELMLSAGEVRDVIVLSDGALHECWATSVPGLAVTLAGTDITKAPAADPEVPGVWVLTIAADATLTEGAATVTCRDTSFRAATLAIGLDV